MEPSLPRQTTVAFKMAVNAPLAEALSHFRAASFNVASESGSLEDWTNSTKHHFRQYPNVRPRHASCLLDDRIDLVHLNIIGFSDHKGGKLYFRGTKGTGQPHCSVFTYLF